LKASEYCLSFVMAWEGTVLHEYLDIVSIKTIGCGHMVLPGESFPNGITHQQALDLLAKDIGKCERAIASNIKFAVDQNQYDALASLSFNAGTGTLTPVNSTLARLLNQGDVQGAADQFLRWCKAGGKTNKGLLNRRIAERAMFLAHDHEADYSEPQVHGKIEPLSDQEFMQVMANISQALDMTTDFTPHHY
jgi:lysozyme